MSAGRLGLSAEILEVAAFHCTPDGCPVQTFNPSAAVARRAGLRDRGRGAALTDHVYHGAAGFAPEGAVRRRTDGNGTADVLCAAGSGPGPAGADPTARRGGGGGLASRRALRRRRLSAAGTRGRGAAHRRARADSREKDDGPPDAALDTAHPGRRHQARSRANSPRRGGAGATAPPSRPCPAVRGALLDSYSAKSACRNSRAL